MSVGPITKAGKFLERHVLMSIGPLTKATEVFVNAF
jgi:hypothetical protein